MIHYPEYEFVWDDFFLNVIVCSESYSVKKSVVLTVSFNRTNLLDMTANVRADGHAGPLSMITSSVNCRINAALRGERKDGNTQILPASALTRNLIEDLDPKTQQSGTISSFNI